MLASAEEERSQGKGRTDKDPIGSCTGSCAFANHFWQLEPLCNQLDPAQDPARSPTISGNGSFCATYWILLDPAQDPARLPTISCNLLFVGPTGSCWILHRILCVCQPFLPNLILCDLLDPAGSCTGSCAFANHFLQIYCSAPALIIILFKSRDDWILPLAARDVISFLEF